MPPLLEYVTEIFLRASVAGEIRGGVDIGDPESDGFVKNREGISERLAFVDRSRAEPQNRHADAGLSENAMWKLLHQMHLITHVGRRQFLYGLLCVGALLHSTVSLASEQPHLVFRAPEHLRPVATRLESMGWPSYRYALELAGLKHPGPAIHVHLVPEHAEMVRHVPEWVSGYAHGASSSIVLFPQRVRSYPARAIEDLLVHEVAHIFNSREPFLAGLMKESQRLRLGHGILKIVRGCCGR